MVKRKAKSQIANLTPRPLKFGNRPDSLVCDISLECYQQGLKLCFIPHLNQRFAHKVMGPQSHGSPNFGKFETSIGSPETKYHLDAGPVAKHKV
jgi:hypothetical protein